MESINLKIFIRRIKTLFFLFGISINLLLAQEKSTSDLLIGTWEIDYNQSIANIELSSKTHYDTISQERRNRMIETFSQRKITFQSDGTYILFVRAGKQVIGTWELLSDNISLKIVLEGRLIEQRVEEISGSMMILDLGGDQSANRIFRRWYLNKVGS